MAGTLIASMTDPPIRHALLQRQSDVDRGNKSQDAASHPRSAQSPLYRVSAMQLMSAEMRETKTFNNCLGFVWDF